jgi:hypothetical protein
MVKDELGYMNDDSFGKWNWLNPLGEIIWGCNDPLVAL